MISTAALVAFTALFLHVTTQEGMINAWVRRWSFRWPALVKKPLYDCPVCMAPWLGALLYAVGAITFTGWADFVLTCLAAGGINALIVYLIGDDAPRGND